MATASDRALHATNGKANFQRLTQLLMCGGITLLREVFDSILPPTDLQIKLGDAIIKAQLRMLIPQKVLTMSDWKILYPSPGVYGKSRDFDITLLFKLFRNLCDLTPPGTGWNELPNSEDLSLEADLVRIKYYRNNVYGHNTTMEIADQEFVGIWREISEVLLRIAGNISSEKRSQWQKSIDAFLHDPLTPDAKRYIEELNCWYKNEMDVKDEVVNLRNEVEQLKLIIRIFVETFTPCICRRGSFGPVSTGHFPSTPQPQEAHLQPGSVCAPISSQESQTEGVAAGQSTHTELQANRQTSSTVLDFWQVVFSFKKSIDMLIEYLTIKLGLDVDNSRPGSLLITVNCSSLGNLERLWEDYCSGHLSEVVQKILVTPEILEELNVSEVTLKTVIMEDEYKEVKLFLKNRSGEANPVLSSQQGLLDKGSSTSEVNKSADYKASPSLVTIHDSMEPKHDPQSTETLPAENPQAEEVESSTWFTSETMAGTGRNGEDLGRTRSSEPIPIPLGNFGSEGNLSPPIQTTDPGSEGNLSPPIQATDPVESSTWFTFETMAGTGRNEEELGRTGSSEPIPIPLDNLIDILRKLSELPKAFPHFVRRQKDELSNILTCLSPDNECQCVLLHGAPGIGKTTLAIQAANEILKANDRALVVYINCKYIYSFADFSEKVIRQVYQSRYPANNPEAEVKNRLIALSKNFFILLLLDNFEFLLGNANDNEQENQRSAASLCPADSEDRRLIKDFIGEIAECVRNVKLLVTSSNIVCFRQIGRKTMTLDPFSPEETFELLKNVHGDRKVTVETSKKLCEACSGIPLVLYILMSSTINLTASVAYMSSSSPHDPAISKSLDYCFSRLRTQEQHTLLSLALVTGWFTLPKVAKAFCSATSSEGDITRHVVKLGNCSLLQQNMFGETCRYTFLSIIREYCKRKAASEEEFRVVFRGARNLLIDHLISFLKDTLKKFLSKDAVESAIEDFAWEKENVIQLVEWIDSGEVDAERVTKCIDAFNVAGELIAKMMPKSTFKVVYDSLVRKCEEMGEQRRLGECLTSLGIKEIFNCTCRTGLCDKATARAQHYLEKANTIQNTLGIKHGNSRAQCLAKLGRCLAKSNDTREQGRGMIEDAILIRQNAVRTPDEEEGGENVCHVMLGATLNDKAVALSLENHHRQAATIREEEVLPIYKKRLGDHPFTATILNNLSNNHRDLREIEAAERYVREALEIRLNLLDVHIDTCKSLFDLAMVLKEKREFQEAKTYLEICKAMQENVADDNPIFVQQTQPELEAISLELGKLQLEAAS